MGVQARPFGGEGRRPAALIALLLTAASLAPARGDEPVGKERGSALPGMIFIAMPLPRDAMHGLLAVDPNTRTCAKLDESGRFGSRVAPHGRRVVYLQPDPDTRKATVFALDLDREGEPVPVFDRQAVVSWAADGKELIVSLLGPNVAPEEPRNWRVNADGTGREPLAIPATELIWDWSPDGEWVLTSSGRPIGNEAPAPGFPHRPLYVMRLDGSKATQLVPPGAPSKTGFGGTMNTGHSGPRFSPNGDRVLYIRATVAFDNGKLAKQESNVCIIDRDGQHPRAVFEGSEEQGHAFSAAWSPDGRAIAIGLQKPLGDGVRGFAEPRLLIVDTDGAHPREIPLPHPSMMSVIDWH